MSGAAAMGRASAWLKWIAQSYFRLLTAAATFAVGIGVTYSAWDDAENSVQAAAEHRFESRLTDVQDAIRGRMTDYAQVLRAGTGLFAGFEQVGLRQWRAYVHTLRLDYSYPGLLGLGVLLRVPQSQLAEHARAIRAEGLPRYEVHPPGERPEYIPVAYIEPLTQRNQRVLGFDMHAEPIRRSALQRARDTGEPAITSRVVLMQDSESNAQPGFLMFAPMYRPGMQADRIEERRTALLGYVYAPFRMRDLMSGLLGSVPDIRLEIYDGVLPDPSALLHDSAPALSGVRRKPSYTRTTQVVVLDRIWTLRTSTLPEFDTGVDHTRAYAALLAGTAITIMLTTLVWILATLRGRALRLAERMTMQLRESRERLSLALEGSNLALFDWDLISDTVTLSPRWNALLGGRAAVTITTIQALRAMVHPDDLPRVTENLARTLEGASPFYDVEHRVRAHDGTWKWVSSHAKVSERDADGRALRITGTNADISERKAVEDLKNDFIGTVSHELRTPLTAIIGALGLLKEEYGAQAPPEAAAFLDMAYQSSEHLAALVNNILDLEKVESGNLELKLERVDLAAFLEQGIALNSAYAEHHGTRFAIEPVEPGIEISADRDRLMQVFTNLLSNAAKYSPAGEPVTVRACVLPGRARIEVADRGPGVPHQFRDRLFTKFAQGAPVDGKPKGGTGLGLAISKAIIEAMKGRIGCDSTVEKGATFYFEVPLTK